MHGELIIVCDFTIDNATIKNCLVLSFSQGDGGSPLICMEGDFRVAAGVYSWGVSGSAATHTDCDPTYPSVYTRISFFLNWIP